jgi:DNA-binding transcriptional LysR family regulator
MRSLGIIQQVLVASPAFLECNGRPTSPAEMARLASVSCGAVQGPHVWKLVNPDEQVIKIIKIHHEPRLIADDMILVRQAAAGGLGIAQLPLSVCLEEIRQGQLEIVLPDFLAPLCEIQAVFPSRQGMLPAVRSFIDFLSTNCVSEVAERHIKRHTGGGHRENVRFWTSRYPLQRVLVESQQCADAKRKIRLA